MKILYLCPDYGIPVLGRKGASVHVRAMVEAFHRAGHQVLLAAPQATKGPWETPEHTSAQFMHLPGEEPLAGCVRGLDEFAESLGAHNLLTTHVRRMLYDRQLSGQLLRRFRKHPPDLIYARAALYSTAPATLARAVNRPLVVELNAPLAAEHSTYRGGGGLEELGLRAEQELLRAADAVVVVSEALRGHAVACGAAPERVQVMPNGVDPERFRPAQRSETVRRRWGLADSDLVLGFVGGLRPWHGVEALPELLGRLLPEHPDARLLVVGEGPLRETLERDLAKRGLAERAVFTGAVSHGEVPDLVRQLDIALAPYPVLEHEFYFSPLKLFEYMACGVPVVAAAIAQISEVVADGETGLLYPPGDRDALAGRCRRLLESAQLRRRIGAAAADTVHRHYTWDRNAEATLALAGQRNDQGGRPWARVESPTS